MFKRLDRVASDTLGALHRDTIDDPAVVFEILAQASRNRSVLNAGIDRRNEQRSAEIVDLNTSRLLLAGKNLHDALGQQIYFNVEISGVTYFFATTPHNTEDHSIFHCPLPAAIYRSERRELNRSPAHGIITIVATANTPGHIEAELVDTSLHGVAVRLPDYTAKKLPRDLQICLDSTSTQLFARIRHRTREHSRVGWIRLGLSVSSVRESESIPVDRREDILGRQSWQGLRGLVELGVHSAKRTLGVGRRAQRQVEIVDFENEEGQLIRGILDRWGARAGSTTVVIPPAWGRTKETLMPLALTIVETFKQAGESVQVLRYDGTNRRGESYIDPECRRPGDEYLHFRFSQAARDLTSAINYVHSLESGAPGRVVLVTFSLAAVEGRYAMARVGNRLAGWVAVVGVADLQSALRTISGGIDYGYGLLRGIRFGRHELVGVVADMDLTGLDAINHKIGFLEDARRDMSRIHAPITWIHGQYDAWMDLDRVIEIMSCGSTGNRKLIEVPTGHQLRSSRAALSTFQLIAEEVSEMATGKRLRGRAPPVARILLTRQAELARLPDTSLDIRSFWENYLLGRDRTLGMELLTATAGYRNFLASQVRLLRLAPSHRAVDLGAGTGEFALSVSALESPENLCIIEVDFVREALKRGRERRRSVTGSRRTIVSQIAADLDLGRGFAIPLGTSSAHAVLASLLISYLPNPNRFLREVFRILKPSGRLVVSSMIEDADVSMLFHDGLVEFATSEARQQLSRSEHDDFERMVRSFLNDGSRLLDLEERGKFKFWNEEDLRHAVANAGFADIRSFKGLGDPPQAVIVSANKP